MKTKKREREAERQYSFEEFLKTFAPKEREQEYPDDPGEIGRRIASEALNELQRNLSKGGRLSKRG